ncbi:MAG: DUF3526 domain-containing protein [Candidatus Eremiobacteraeota bacterium]|nr:DUF3526 domain-containing protein [Candidatus Eremiobacteraeota bacterium]MCW5869384.1 DUF3526 domain-containing protein [Candidatus Eremiobacteraeota bacterium]
MRVPELDQALRIAAREFIELRRNQGLRWLSALIAILLLLSVAVGRRQAANLEAQRAALQAEVERQFQNQPDRHPHRVAHYGFVAFRPRSPLAYFDFGIDSFVGNSIFLEAHRQNPANFGESRQSTSVLRFGQLSTANVLQVYVPLFIIFSAFGAVTLERERHTLRLLWCQGVTSRALLLGKVLAGWPVLALVWLPVFGFCAIAALAGGSPDSLVRVLALSLFYLAYFLLWQMLAVLVSARSPSSTASLALLLGFWALALWLVPRSLPNLAERFWPTPSKPEFEFALHHDVSEAGNGHDSKDAKFHGLQQELLKKYRVDKVEQLPVNFNGITMREGERRSSEIYARHYDRLQALFEKQNRLGTWAGLLDPYLDLREASMALSMSGYLDFADFQRQAEAYRFQMVDHLNQLHSQQISYAGDKEQRLARDHWKEFPEFGYRPPAIRTSLLRCLPAALCLIFLNVLLVTGLARQRVQAV